MCDFFRSSPGPVSHPITHNPPISTISHWNLSILTQRRRGAEAQRKTKVKKQKYNNAPKQSSAPPRLCVSALKWLHNPRTIELWVRACVPVPAPFPTNV